MIKIDLTEDEPEWSQSSEWPDEAAYESFQQLAFQYARYVLAPPILAERLRRKGDERASPRDFECDCPVLAETCQPYCLFARGKCRFAGTGAANVKEAAEMIEEASAAMFNIRGERPKLLQISRKSANQMLSYELMKRISRKYLDASARGRAEIISEMERGIERASRRNKCKADR